MKIALSLLLTFSFVTLCKVWKKPVIPAPDPPAVAHMKPVVIEGCEYLVIDLGVRGLSMAHKGNCTNWAGHVAFMK